MIPLPYRISAIAALLLAVFGLGARWGLQHEHAKWEADTAARVQAENTAILARTAANATLAAQQASTNATITKAQDEELATVRARLAAAERMRRPAFCGGTAATAEAARPASSASADPASGLVPDTVAADIQALILKTEEVAATGRACQAFVHENGFDQ